MKIFKKKIYSRRKDKKVVVIIGKFHQLMGLLQVAITILI